MRVIAVDNKFFWLFFLTRAIKRKLAPGAEVKCFRSPSEALRYAREHPVDVAFIEMETREIHGLIMAMKLQEINPEINLIFMSVSGDYALDSWRIHASDYLLKPIEPKRVEQSLTNLRYPVHDPYISV